MQEWIQKNPELFILVWVVIALICLAGVVIGKSKEKRKKREVLAKNANLVEIAFDESVLPAERFVLSNAVGFNVYKIYSVNGEKPHIIGKSLLVPGGKVRIDLQYIVSGGGITTTFERIEFSFGSSPGIKYKMSYEVLDRRYECKET